MAEEAKTKPTGRFIFTLDDSGPIIYDPEDLTLGESFELKKLTGYTVPTFNQAFAAQDPEAWRFAWYIANKRHGTPLPGRYSDIDFKWADLEFEAELEAIEDEPVAPAGDDDLPTSPASQE